MPLMASLPDEITTPAQFRSFLGQMQIEVMDNLTDTALLAVAREKGISVWLDVEGDAEGLALWNEALRKDIQGMQTDHPAELIAYLKQTGQRNGRAVSFPGIPAE
jgi:glycerophosphoryl diester phosphodiesterase